MKFFDNLKKDRWEKKGIDLLEMAKFHREKAEGSKECAVIIS